jgi:hypothetical protein
VTGMSKCRALKYCVKLPWAVGLRCIWNLNEFYV